MKSKSQRRKAAQARAKQRRLTLMALCGAVVLVGILVAVVVHIARPGSRVYAAAGNLSVTLYDNGNFSARLAHNRSLRGTFAEQVYDAGGNIVEVAFTHDGMTVSAQIVNDVLLLPVEWRATCAHGHAVEFPLRR